MGAAWAANGMIYPLRAPQRDGMGIGVVATFAWTPAPTQGFLGVVAPILEPYWEMQAESARIQAEGNMALGRAIGAGIDRMIHTHQDDAADVALDVLCVALSLPLLPTGIGALGVMELVGGAILLGADGVAYAKEIGSGDLTHDYTRKRRVFATADMTDEDAERIVASLPTQEELHTGRWAWQSDEVPSRINKSKG